MKKLIKNLFGDIFTTAVGSVAGVPEIIEGAGQLSEEHAGRRDGIMFPPAPGDGYSRCGCCREPRSPGEALEDTARCR